MIGRAESDFMPKHFLGIKLPKIAIFVSMADKNVESIHGF